MTCTSVDGGEIVFEVVRHAAGSNRDLERDRIERERGGESHGVMV